MAKPFACRMSDAAEILFFAFDTFERLIERKKRKARLTNVGILPRIRSGTRGTATCHTFPRLQFTSAGHDNSGYKRDNAKLILATETTQKITQTAAVKMTFCIAVGNNKKVLRTDGAIQLRNEASVSPLLQNDPSTVDVLALYFSYVAFVSRGQ